MAGQPCGEGSPYMGCFFVIRYWQIDGTAFFTHILHNSQQYFTQYNYNHI